MSQKGIKAKTTIDPIDKIVKEREQEEKQDDIHRIAFNMPKYVYDDIHPKIKKQKITMTTYIMGLIRKDIGEI